MQGIYCYIDKKDNSIVYIGKDSNIDKNKRHKEHMASYYYDRQKINKILQNNLNRYEYNVLKQGEFKENFLNALEIIYIERYNPKFNFTKGGDGVFGYKWSNERKQKMSDKMKGKNHPFYGKHHSQETKNKISKSKTGTKLSNETKQLLSKIRAKYTLWDYKKVSYDKSTIKNPNEVYKTFRLKYNKKKINIGRFEEFISPTIIYDLIEEEIK